MNRSIAVEEAAVSEVILTPFQMKESDRDQARLFEDSGEAAELPTCRPSVEKRAAKDPDLLPSGLADCKVGGLLRAGIPLFSDIGPAQPVEAGVHIGPYRLVSLVGEGGFGMVWRAQQDEPIHREVALKLIKPGMDRREIVKRFEGERQALALMDHPHIASVLDAGESESGQPWFAMELVKGVPITDYCDAKRLTIRERLRLFVPVCRAVQHAHQKGILHRDLKPTNLLVEESDGLPVPKVIDFGIAKALGTGTAGAEGLSLLHTQGFSVVGTPLYMSPEQAGLDGLDIDSRSDIYSLGAVLYELLTGTTPLTREMTDLVDFSETLRKIREWDPPGPRRRISELAETGSAVAESRQTECRRLQTQLRGDLDWIVLKALNKDRERRYVSAAALAEDIERHLASEPVSAGPPSAAYRLGRLARRHRGTLAAASIVTGALLVGLGLATWQAVRATRAEGVAEARLTETLREKERADAETARADERAAVAEAVADFLKNDLLGQASTRSQANRGFTPNPNLTVRDALERAAGRARSRFADQPLLEAEILDTIGEAKFDMGTHASAMPELERAHLLFAEHLGPDDLKTLVSESKIAIVLIHSGKARDAIPILERVIARLTEKLGREAPETVRVINLLGTAHARLGEHVKAFAHFEESLESSVRQYGPEHPLSIEKLANSAASLRAQGRMEEALARSEAALRLNEKILGKDHPRTVLTRTAVGKALIALGRPSEALQFLEEAMHHTRKVHSDEHGSVPDSISAYATALDAVGRTEEAALYLRESVGLRRRYRPREVSTLIAISTLGDYLLKSGKHPEAVELHEEAWSLSIELSGRDDTKTIWHANKLGRAYWMGKDFASSIPVFEEAWQLATARLGPMALETILVLANLGVNYYDSGQVENGIALLDEALRRIEELPEDMARQLAWVEDARAQRALGPDDKTGLDHD